METAKRIGRLWRANKQKPAGWSENNYEAGRRPDPLSARRFGPGEGMGLASRYWIERMKVGFIGLGRMGKGMAQRILGAGHDLAVYDVMPQATAEFKSSDARVASSVADLCKDREVVITMLAEDAAVHDVALGPSGMCASLPAGAIHMASGTYGIPTIRALEGAHAKANQI